MKRMIAFLLFVAAFPAVAGAQCFEGGSLGHLMAGPCAERMFRQGYAPVDFAIGQAGQYAGYGYPVGYGYGPGGYGRTAAIATGAVTGMAAGAAIGAGFGHNTRSALIGGGIGAAVGGLATYAVTRSAGRSGQAVYAADGQQVIFAQPRAQKPLDCRKPAGKRGKNEVACEAAEAELAAQQQVAQRQACSADLATSPWRLRNGSDRFTFTVTENGRPSVVCGEQVVLRPLQTIRIFPPNGQISGKSFGAASSGEKKELEARIEAVNRPGFVGFVLLAPGAPERRE